MQNLSKNIIVKKLKTFLCFQIDSYFFLNISVHMKSPYLILFKKTQN